MQGWTKTGQFPPAGQNRTFNNYAPRALLASPDGQIMVLTFVYKETEFIDGESPKRQKEAGETKFLYLKCDASGSGQCSEVRREALLSQYGLATLVDGVMHVPDLCHSCTRRVKVTGGKVETLEPSDLRLGACLNSGAHHSAEIVFPFHLHDVIAVYGCHDLHDGAPCDPRSRRVFVMNATSGVCKSLLYAYDRSNGSDSACVDWGDSSHFLVEDVVAYPFACDLLLFVTEGVVLLDLVTMRLSVLILRGIIIGGAVDGEGIIYVSAFDHNNIASTSSPILTIYMMTKNDIIHNTPYDRIEVLHRSGGPGKMWVANKIAVTPTGLAIWWTDAILDTLSSVNVLQFYKKIGDTFPGALSGTQQKKNQLKCAPVMPVSGGWSSWGAWSDCSVTCGQGLSYRQRQCNNPPPTGHLTFCLGQVRMTTSCYAAECETSSAWGHWGRWQACSASCGSGYRQRSRVCHVIQDHGQDCDGDGVTSEHCATAFCLPASSAAPKPGASSVEPDGRVITTESIRLLLALALSNLFIAYFMIISVHRNHGGLVTTVLQSTFGFVLLVCQTGIFISTFYSGFDAECTVSIFVFHWGCEVSLCLLLTMCFRRLLVLKSRDSVFVSRDTSVVPLATSVFLGVLVPSILLSALPALCSTKSYVEVEHGQCWFASTGLLLYLAPQSFCLLVLSVMTVVAYIGGPAESDPIVQQIHRIRRQSVRVCLEMCCVLALFWSLLSTHFHVHQLVLSIATDLSIFLHTLVLAVRFLKPFEQETKLPVVDKDFD
ncbi:hypothetical protein V1264_013422 [Littorina saxatilis]|uniref:Uncharacterized protein n=2 Tax=Littorina saxatilis TaxID=31220 RepID=A0AAN9BPI0_9CAEN